MDIQAWGILISLLLVSSRADYNHESQKLYLTSSSPKPQNYETKEIVLYLTPRQIKAFKSNGAVVKFQSDAESEFSFERQQQAIAEQVEKSQKEENKRIQETELEFSKEQNQDLDLTEFFTATDEEKEKNEESITQSLKKTQIEEKNTLQAKEISSQLKNRTASQRQEKYVAPALAQKNQPKYSYPHNHEIHRLKVRRFLPRQQEIIELDEHKQELQTEESPVVQKIFKLFPSTVASKSEEWTQEDKHKEEPTEHADRINTLFLNHEKLIKSIGQHVYKLVENEFNFQSLLQDLKASPNYIDQTYAIHIEKQRSNPDKRHYKSGDLVLTSDETIKKEFEEVPASTPFVVQVPKPFEISVPKRTAVTVSSVKPVAATEAEKTKVDKTISDNNNIYINVDKSYFEERIPYEIQKETPIRKPEKLSIVRPVWEY